MQAKRMRKMVSYADVGIEVIAEGIGPSVVILPSRARHSEDFDLVADHVAAAGFRVLRPQPRGIGKSVGPLRDVTLHDFARDAAAVIEHEALGPAVLIGHGFGSSIASMTAADYPTLVRGVVAAAAPARGPVPKYLEKALSTSADNSLPTADRVAALQTAFFAPRHDCSVWLDGWQKQAGEAQGIALQRTRIEEWWSAGAAPLLDLQAELDPWRPRATVNQRRDGLGDRVTVDVIPDSSHALIHEQPEEFVGRFLRWQRRLA